MLAIPLQDFSRGDAEPQPLAVAAQRVAVNICYEDAFGEEIIRQLPAATLLVNVSNVAWFGRSIAPRQHLQISQMRALETGRYMLRATNTGMTAVIDERGDVVAGRAAVHDAAVVDASVQGHTGATPYVRWGNASSSRCASALIAALRCAWPQAARTVKPATNLARLASSSMLTFQQIILALNQYWDAQGCALLQPYDMEVGAGTFHTATFLRAIGPEPWNAAYVQPSRRPKDGRYGENPNRLQHYYQYQVVMKPSPRDLQDLYLGSLHALGIDPQVNDIRFVEDDWESPTLGAWGLGWEVWLNGMEVTQFTYFQQVGGLDCRPVLGELTYGLERLAMYLQGKDNVFDLVWVDGVTYRDVYHQNEVEQSRYNFELANVDWLLRQFDDYESEAKRLVEAGLVLPGLRDGAQVLAHLQPARCARRDLGDRARGLHRARARARAAGRAGYYDSREALGFPMCKRQALRHDAADLLVELLTEELPPKALARLGTSVRRRTCRPILRSDGSAGSLEASRAGSQRRAGSRSQITSVRDAAPPTGRSRSRARR